MHIRAIAITIALASALFFIMTLAFVICLPAYFIKKSPNLPPYPRRMFRA